MKLILLANIGLAANAWRDKLDGVSYLVCPTVIIKEGVLNNIFYPADKLKETFRAWNGKPVPVNHPVDENGTAITANSVACENTVNIGQFWNASFDETLKGIKGEVWINIAKAKAQGYAHIVERLELGLEIMEVSTGLYSNTVAGDGEFGGKAYNATIGDINPDHLALLPNEVGACSVADGCGALRHNEALVTNCGDKACTCGNKPKAKPNLLNILTGFFFNKQEESHNKIREALQRAVREVISPQEWAYVADVFDSYFVFELDGKLFKYLYTLDDKGNAILVGDRIEVKVKTEYVPVSAELTTNKQTMKPERKTALVAALALALIGNVAGVTEEKKTSLNALDDDMLNNMADAKGIKLDDDGKPIVANVATPPPLPPNVVPIANAMSDEDRVLLNTLQAEKNARLLAKRTALTSANPAITNILANKMDESELDAMLANANPVQTYGIGGFLPTEPVTNEAPKKREAPKVIFAEAK